MEYPRKEKIKIFEKFNKEYSLVMNFVIGLYNILLLFSIYNWLKVFLVCKNIKLNPKRNIIDAYIFLQIALIFYLLYTNTNLTSIIISIYILIEVLFATLRDLVAYISNKNKPINLEIRWLFITFLNIFIVIFAFGVLYKNFGIHFDPNIVSSISALYMSFVSFASGPLSVAGASR